jgi:hypothetical protein
MHATTDLVPARTAVRRHFVSSGASDLAGDPIATEAMATRVGLFSAFRRIGRAAKGAALLATAPVRALGGAGVNVLKTTGNLAKGIESTTALPEYLSRPLAWRPGKKRRGPAPPAPAGERSAEPDAKQPEEEEPMTEDTSGNPKPQADQVRRASSLLRRARSNPKSARHVKNIAKAAATGHPGAQLAQAAIAAARRQQPKAPPPVLPPMPRPVRSGAFTSWGRGAA